MKKILLATVAASVLASQAMALDVSVGTATVSHEALNNVDAVGASISVSHDFANGVEIGTEVIDVTATKTVSDYVYGYYVTGTATANISASDTYVGGTIVDAGDSKVIAGVEHVRGRIDVTASGCVSYYGCGYAYAYGADDNTAAYIGVKAQSGLIGGRATVNSEGDVKLKGTIGGETGWNASVGFKNYSNDEFDGFEQATLSVGYKLQF